MKSQQREKERRKTARASASGMERFSSVRGLIVVGVVFGILCVVTFYVFLSLSKSVDNVICWFYSFCSYFQFNRFGAVFITIATLMRLSE